MQRKGIWGSLTLIVLVSGLAWGLTNLHTSQAQASRAVTTYKQWQKAYVAGKSQKYVKANNGQGATTAFSEGQGYGMLAAVLAAKKGANTRTTFNQLYKYYRAHRISSSLPLMQWK